MSVLFKALQKAEKENEQRQTTAGGSGFDAGRLAGSGAIKRAGGGGINWRTAGIAAAGVLAVAIAGAFFLAQPPSMTTTTTTTTTTQVAVVKTVPGTTEVTPVLQPPAPAPAAAAPVQQMAEATPAAVAPAAVEAAPTAVEMQPEEAPVASPAPAVAKPAPARVTVAAAPTRPQPMPELAADSPTRMLNPPIAVQRAEFELAGVGRAVQVREVSQNAQNNVGAGYSALVSGAYDMSLGFYDRALREEPNSVLALLGRGAALQKMGKNEYARASYEKVLKIDPANREALSNLTVITGERSPAEALTKLLDLEKQYPTFSPIKAQVGLTYAKMGQMPEALDYLRRATSMSPESVMYQYNLALVLDHLGRSEQAVAAYENVLAALSGGRGMPELSGTDIERRVRFLRTR